MNNNNKSDLEVDHQALLKKILHDKVVQKQLHAYEAAQSVDPLIMGKLLLTLETHVRIYIYIYIYIYIIYIYTCV